MWLHADGNGSLRDSVGTQIGNSFAVPSNEWVNIEVGNRYQSGGNWTTVRVNGTEVATDNVASLISGVIKVYAVPGADIWIDDIALGNSSGSQLNAWIGDSKVVLLAPTADNINSNWTGGLGGTSDLYEAVNNLPPIGSASETDLTQIESASSSLSSYQPTYTTFAHAGIGVNDTLAFFMGYCCHGEDISTGTKSGRIQLWKVGNAAHSAEYGWFPFGGDSGALGAYPTNWRWAFTSFDRNTAVISPSDAVALRIDKDIGTTRVASVCGLFVYVEYVTAPANNLSGSATVGAAASGTITATSGNDIALAGAATVAAQAQAALAVAKALAGAATGSAQGEAALSLTKPLAGSAATAAQAEAALGVLKALAGVATAGAAADGALVLAKALQSSSTMGALASAGIMIGKPLAGAATGGADAQGSLSNTAPGGVNLAGAAAVGALAQGALGVAIPLAGNATGGAQADANLTKLVGLNGAAIVGATSQAGVSVGVPLSGAAIAGAGASGTLLLAIALQGSAIAGALAQASLSIAGVANLAGSAGVGASAAGALGVGKPLQGAGSAGALAQATLQLDVRLATAALGGASGAGNLTIAVPLSGAAIAAAQASGTLTVLLGFSGTAVTGSLATGTLTMDILLGGSAVVGATASAAFPDSTLMAIAGYIVRAPARRLTLAAKDRTYTVAARPRRLRINA